MKKFIKIESTDNTDTLIAVDKIQYVLQTAKGCYIRLEGDSFINTTAKYKDVIDAIERLVGAE